MALGVVHKDPALNSVPHQVSETEYKASDQHVITATLITAPLFVAATGAMTSEKAMSLMANGATCDGANDETELGNADAA